MPTLYNQYIYRNGAWRQTGTSSDSVTYTISLSGNTLTLTGSNGSSSSVTISSGGNESVFVAEYNVTSHSDILAAYNAGKALFAVKNDNIYTLNNFDENYDEIFIFKSPFLDGTVYIGTVACNNVSGWDTDTVAPRIGKITADGDIATTTTIASGDRLVINDESASELNNSSITFGTDTTKYLANDGTWQDIPADSVISVNSKTGAVTLTASDVGALPSSTTIPSATSDLTNDSNFVSDASYVHTDNNFTITLKDKLDGIEAGATVDDKTWNGVALGSGRIDTSSDLWIPAKSNDKLTGTAYWVNTTQEVPDNNYSVNIPRYKKIDNVPYLQSTTPTAGDNTTKVATTAFVKSAVDTAISGVNSFEYEVVQTLPTTNIKDHTIYLVPKTGTTNDVYDEYMYISNAWEHIGSTDVDLSGYVPTSRTVNNKALSSDITLTASDVGALPDSTTIPSQTAKIWTGSCSTASDVSSKVVTLDDATGFSLTAGVKIAIRFDVYSELDNIKLNVNNTGEKYVGIYMSTNTLHQGKDRVTWGNSETVLFTYYGTYWLFEGSGLLQGKTYTLASSALPKSGGTMTGALTLNADPTSNMQASTKQYVDTAVSAKQSKPTITSATLAVASWSNGVYSFESTYPNASYNIDVEPDGYTITDAQFKAWNEAKIVGNSNGNTIKALGTVPTVAIPIVVRATPK